MGRKQGISFGLYGSAATFDVTNDSVVFNMHLRAWVFLCHKVLEAFCPDLPAMPFAAKNCVAEFLKSIHQIVARWLC